jgi:CPA1 family monovalent cation:H+ antiporter
MPPEVNVISFVLGLASLLLLVSLLVPMSKRVQVPFTVLLAIAGIGLGFVQTAAGHAGGIGSALVNAIGVLTIPAEAFLYVFLPPLLFAGGLTVDVRRLFDDIAPVLMLAVVAVLACMAAVGVSLHVVSGMDLILCLIIGALVATTDTAAVLGIFRDIGAPSRLSVIVEGESLFNDAAAIALFVVLLAVFTGGGEPSFVSGTIEFVKGFVGGLLLGYLMALVAGFLISQWRGAAVTEITLSVAFTYLTFVLGQAYFEVSGIIAVVTAAMVFASNVRTRLSPGTWETLLVTWRQLEFWATSLIFVLASMLAPRMFSAMEWTDGLAIATVFVVALVARAGVLWGALPSLSWFGLSQPISHAYKLVLCWGSLRGAVTVALALLAATDISEGFEGGGFSPEARFIFVVGLGYVFATLFISAPTLRPLMKALKLDKLSAEERLVRDRVMSLSRSRVREGLVRVAETLGLREALVPAAPAQAAATQGDAPLKRDDLIRAGLIVMANRETELGLEYLQRGLVGRTVAERLRADASRVLDGVRQSGTAGYLTAALGGQKHGWQFRLALWLQRRMRLKWLLEEEVANRFELLLVKQLVLRELLVFCDGKVAELIGNNAALSVREAIEGRLAAVGSAIETLDLQYPDFTKAMRSRYLERLAIGLEEAEYRGQLEQSLISDEVFESLEEDRTARRKAAEARPPLDLGLRLTEMLAKVPILAGLQETQIAELARALTPELFPPGERIINAGERGDRMYFIASGAVEVMVGQEPVRLKAGDFVGEMALLTDRPRNADVVSAGYTNLLVLKRRDFDALLKSHPGLRDKITGIARQRESENRRSPAEGGG